MTFLSAFTSIVSAQWKEITEYFNGLWWGDLFGYSTEQYIQVQNISDNSIDFSSPVIKNENDENIGQYNVLFGEYTMNEVLDNPDLIDAVTEKKITTTENSDFTFSLTVNEDNLDVNKIYFVSVAPRDASGIIGAVSNEYCFNLENQVYSVIEWDKEACVKKIAEKVEMEKNTLPWNIHNAAQGADMSLANVTHTIDGNSVKLTWISQVWSDKVEVYLLNEDETGDGEPARDPLGTVDMMDGEFIFPYQGAQTTTLLLKPTTDGVMNGIEHVYAINETPPVEKEPKTPVVEPQAQIKVVPQTWAKENFLVIFIISILGFVLYRAMRKTK